MLAFAWNASKEGEKLGMEAIHVERGMVEGSGWGGWGGWVVKRGGGGW